MKVTIEIDDRIIVGTLDSAFAGGSRYWVTLAGLSRHGTDTKNAWAGHVMSGGAVKINSDEGTHTVTATKIRRGVVVMQKVNPYQFGLMLSDQ